MGTIYPISGKSELLHAIDAATTQQPVRVATLNPEFMLEGESNPAFRNALTSMTHCTLDGFGLYALLRLFGSKTPARYPGADLVQDLYAKYADGSKKLFLLGGLDDEAEDAAIRLHELYPNLVIAGRESGGVITAGDPPEPGLFQRILAAQPDILLVGFGAPKQELWIEQASLESLSVPVMIGVGGSFGFLSHKRRAPLVFRRLGIEWLYRGMTEKGHWRRVWRAVIVFPCHFIFSILSNG